MATTWYNPNIAAHFKTPDRPDCCVMFETQNYGGKSLQLCLDGYTHREFDLRHYGFNDKLSSWICGRDVAYQWWNAPNKGSYGNGTGGAGGAYTPDIVFHDRATMLHLDAYDAVNGRGAALLWTEKGCRGTSSPVYSSDELGKTIYHTDHDLWYYNYRHDWTSAVMIPLGYELTMWDWDGFQGDSVKYWGKMNSDGYMTCQDLNDFNERTASAAIMKMKSPYATGRW